MLSGELLATSERKAFSPEALAKYDSPAKRAVEAFLTAQGHRVGYPADEYTWDLHSVSPSGEVLYVEVEVRPKAWRGSRWLYPTVHVLQRKLKMIPEDVPASFWLFAVDSTYLHAMTVRGDVILDHLDHAKHVPNSEVEEGEIFVSVPVSVCHYRKIA